MTAPLYVYVSDLKGDDSTGVVNDPALPFKSIQTAVDAAASARHTDQICKVMVGGGEGQGGAGNSYNQGDETILLPHRFHLKGFRESGALGRGAKPVSYTHLTLPTILRV